MDGMPRDVAARIDAVEAVSGERLHLSRSLETKLAGARNLDAARVVEICTMRERRLAAIPEGTYRRRAGAGLIGIIALRLAIVVTVIVCRELI